MTLKDLFSENKIWMAMADACFNGTGMSVEARFQWAKDHNCLSMEAGEDGIRNPELYLKAMDSTGLFIHGVNVWVAGDDFFLKAIEAAKTFGARYITHQVPRQASIEEGVAFLKKHQQLCRDNGLQYLMETHRWTASELLSDTKAYLEAIPDLDILSDTSHYIPLLVEREELQCLHPRAKAAHVRVAMPNNVQVEIGQQMNHEGCQLFKGIWTDLLQSGFSGPVVGEIIPLYVTYPSYNATEDNAFGLELFRQTVIEAGYADKLV